MKTPLISRRTVLRGLGTAIALPWLEAMGPLVSWAAADRPGAKPAPNRMAFLYVPNGKNMADWTPKKVGAGFDLPAILEPLKPVKEELLVLTGLTADKARANGELLFSSNWDSTQTVQQLLASGSIQVHTSHDFQHAAEAGPGLAPAQPLSDELLRRYLVQAIDIWRAAGMDEDFLHGTVARRVERGLHLHRLDGEENVARLDHLARFHGNSRDQPRHRSGDVGVVAVFGLGPRGELGSGRPVRHLDDARLPVELEEYADLPLVVGLADRLQAHDQGLAALDGDGDLVAHAHAVEVDRRRQRRDRTVFPRRAGEFREHLGVHQGGG